MSKSIDESEKILAKLADIGLNEKESRVYLALLPYRDIGSSKLIRATGLHGQFVYDALERLEELRLAGHVIQNGRKKFSANSPARILSLLEEKKLSAQTIVRQLQKRFVGTPEQHSEIFQGDSAFVAHQIDLLTKAPRNSAIDVIASESDRYEMMIQDEGMWDEFTSLLREKNMQIHYIGSEAQRDRLQKIHRELPFWTYRILPGHATGLMDTDIWHDNITLNIFGDPVVSFTFTNKEVADGYRKFFDTLWNLSSE